MGTFFITGTDTGVGKTLVACALLEAAKQRGLTCLGLKPLAAGCEQTDQGWCNYDALALQTCSSLKLEYQQINPVALREAIAPHIAAAHEDKRLSLSRLVGYSRGALQSQVDFCVVEGAGGWRVPLNPVEYLSGLPKELNLPVILVVGIRLGCLNHALLTAEAIQRDGLQLAAWVANVLDAGMSAVAENIATLKSLLPCPLLGEIPPLVPEGALEGCGPGVQALVARAAAYLQIEPLVPAL